MNSFLLLLSCLLASNFVLGHGPPLSHDALIRREAHLSNARRSFSACHNSALNRRSLESARKLRHAELVARYQKSKRSLHARYPVESPSPATDSYISQPTSPLVADDPFASDRIPACILAPEDVVGPLYIPLQPIRHDLRESTPGVDLLLDVQVYDVRTCNPLPEVTMDFWSVNATGKYSGFESEGTAGLTFLRGSQKADYRGVVQALTKFPGYYEGRAVHMHIMAHLNGSTPELNGNRVYQGGSVPHVGQLYFPMDTINEVMKYGDYAKNKGILVKNDEDQFLTNVANSDGGYDPIVHIERIGDNLADGLLAWTRVGIDSTANYSSLSGDPTDVPTTTTKAMDPTENTKDSATPSLKAFTGTAARVLADSVLTTMVLIILGLIL
ncbi:Intradiol ring-cleavage dioxygenase [Geopyxis carbonaria]|nr:Intradiol ring-cleavage dioxygenase [Geopyxis carbonaria]